MTNEKSNKELHTKDDGSKKPHATKSRSRKRIDEKSVADSITSSDGKHKEMEEMEGEVEQEEERTSDTKDNGKFSMRRSTGEKRPARSLVPKPQIPAKKKGKDEPPKKPRGRPKLDEDDLRMINLTVRVTKAEKHNVETMARIFEERDGVEVVTDSEVVRIAIHTLKKMLWEELDNTLG
tara:strand:+ start:409 stop:945 length:537 start_codon:yes stop_codon:yes gene_type:complete